MGNANKINFVSNMDNGKTPFIEAEEVEYGCVETEGELNIF